MSKQKLSDELERLANSPHLFRPIMVIDDDEAFRTRLSSTLQGAGATVISMSSGTHAIRFIQNQPWNWYPSLIITDIVMDGIGGYEIIRRMQEYYPKQDIPVIVVSKLSAAIDVGEAEIAGASAYIAKPIEDSRLFEAINLVLSRKKKGVMIIVADPNRKKTGKKKQMVASRSESSSSL